MGRDAGPLVMIQNSAPAEQVFSFLNDDDECRFLIPKHTSLSLSERSHRVGHWLHAKEESEIPSI